MQQVTVQEQVEHASLGWRFAAVLVDTVVLFGLLIIAMMVYILVLAAQGRIDPQDPAAVQALSQDLGVSDLMANVVVFGALFVYYAVLEGIFGASVGKLVFRMRVVMADGSKPTGNAVIVRNLVRIPEAWLLYIPAGISCLASSRRQRLGDHAARTMVVRRRLSVAGGVATFGPPAPPAPAPPVYGQPVAPASSPGGAWVSSPVAPAVATAPDTGEALASLKTAALAARGAHLNYLRFSERELAGGAADPAAGYSQEYVGAWFTLADAVAALRAAWDAATAAAVASGRTLDEVCAGQADLAHLLRELTPYSDAETDEEIHAAFLAVARGESSAT
jgi:uncharacterized RDD family membrane protein YckC